VRGVFQEIWHWIKENIIPIIIRLRDIAVDTFMHFKQVIEDNREPLQRIWDRIDAVRKVLFAVLLPIIRLVFVEVLPRVLNAVILIIDDVSGAIEKVVVWVQKAYTWIHDKLGSEKVKDAIHGLVKPAEDFLDVVQSIVNKIQWLIDHIPDIPHLPKEPGWSKGGLLGDGVIGAGIGSMAGMGAISPTLYDDIALGQGFGLGVSSGYRPGAVTSSGNPSLHGVFPSKAVDMSGSESAMRAFFLAEVARGAFTGLREIIHSPFWWHPGVGITRISDASVMAGHYNHVHVGSYDRGGYLAPGWNLAYNGLGRPEPVGAGNTYNFNGAVLDGDKLYRLIRELEVRHQRRGGV
jgi:hypothetical protein